MLPSPTICALNTLKPRPPNPLSRPRDGFPNPTACPLGPRLAPLAHNLCPQHTKVPPPKPPLSAPRWLSKPHSLPFRPPCRSPCPQSVPSTHSSPAPQISSLGPEMASQTPTAYASVRPLAPLAPLTHTMSPLRPSDSALQSPLSLPSPIVPTLSTLKPRPPEHLSRPEVALSTSQIVPFNPPFCEPRNRVSLLKIVFLNTF